MASKLLSSFSDVFIIIFAFLPQIFRFGCHVRMAPLIINLTQLCVLENALLKFLLVYSFFQFSDGTIHFLFIVGFAYSFFQC